VSPWLEVVELLECFITAELFRSSAPRAVLQLQESLSSGGFRETWSTERHFAAYLDYSWNLAGERITLS
jgi:hypothetical protein